MEDDNFSSEFQVEAHDMLNDAEDALLGIESNPSPLDAYNIIFRSFHSVKGGAGMFHMTELADYMHKVETLFSHFKEQPEQIQGYITDYFLELIDNVRVLLAGEEISEDVVYNYDELMKINSTQGPETPAAVKPNLNLTEKKQEISQRVERTHKGVVFAIDDEKLILKVIKTFLEDSDFEVHCFDSPIEAIEKTKEMLPDLILSDYKMPQMNGLEMMKEIFKIDPDIPFIFLSAYLTKETMQDAMMHGVFNFLEKPIDETVLVHAVKNAITKRKSMELAYKSINHLVYHYYDLREYLLKQNKQFLADELRDSLKSFLEQKIIIRDLMKQNL